MKRYLSMIFVMISMVIVFLGLKSDVRWSGIATWAITFILLLFAAYFTKYIPNKRNEQCKKNNYVESE